MVAFPGISRARRDHGIRHQASGIVAVCSIVLLLSSVEVQAQCPASNACSTSSPTPAFAWTNLGSWRTAEFAGNTTDSTVYVLNTSTGNAVYAYANNASGGNAVIAGSMGGFGVFASTAATPQQGYPAIKGASNGTDGVVGDSNSGNGVRGKTRHPWASGVYGENLSGGFGVAGRSDTLGVAIYGDNTSTVGGWSGYFTGRVAVLGWLQKSGGGFTIDHPLDPTNRILNHSFVESPDMKNFYDGVAQLDARGEAWVELPAWFSALNRDFRYQLTPIGAPASLFIAAELSGNRFKIAGGKPNLRVSWSVTGIRQDAWAEKNRMQVEELKPKDERGTYLTPEAFGAPTSQGVAALKTRGLSQKSLPSK